MRRIGDGAQVLVGQQDAAGCFHMRGKHHLGALHANGLGHIGSGAWCPGVLRSFTLLARLANDRAAAQTSIGVENLRPAVAEPAIAHNQHFFAIGKLARHGFHAKSAAARHQHGGVGVVDLFEHAQNVLHRTDKLFGHVIERPVGVHHREFEQAIGIDVGKQSRHEVSPFTRAKRRVLFS